MPPANSLAVKEFLTGEIAIKRMLQYVDEGTAKRMASIAAKTITADDNLVATDLESQLRSLLTAAELQLDAGGIQGHAYFVPFGKQCTLMVGYKGYCELVRRSGKCTAPIAEVVYDCDEFDVSLGTDRRIHHKPNYDGDRDDDRVTHAYAITTLIETGQDIFDVLTRSDIEKARNVNKKWAKGPWGNWFAEMAKKTALRRLCKNLPLGPDISEKVETATRLEYDGFERAPAEPDDGRTRSQQLAERLAPPEPEYVEGEAVEIEQ